MSLFTSSGAGLSDGTNSGNVIAGDVGQGGLVTVPARHEVSFTTTTVQAVATTDVSNYRFASVHIVTQGTASSVGFQGSNDNVNWVTVSGQQANVTTAGQFVTSSTSANAVFEIPLGFRYFRLNVTGISAGTTAGVIEFFAQGAPRMSSPTTTSTIALASGGCSTFRNINLTSTGQNIKATSGSLYGWSITNTSAGVRIVKFYNKGTAPTVGTDTPTLTIAIPAGATVTQYNTVPIAFSTGIGIGATQLVADADTTAPAANDVVANIFWL